MTDLVKIRTTVTEELKRHLLFRGTLIAFIGFVPILYAGAFVPQETLEVWGLPIFFGGGALIVFGLLPYRRLCRREENPAEIVLDEQQKLRYVVRGQVRLCLSFDAIRAARFTTRGRLYGIRLETEEGAYFLPYFSKRSAKRLQEYL